MNLETGRFYCLPDGYEVEDASLADIKYAAHPTYTRDMLTELDAIPQTTANTEDGPAAKGSDGVTRKSVIQGKEYRPGYVGLNNIKANDYMNVIIHALAHIEPIRDYFLLKSDLLEHPSELMKRFGLLVRKIWNPRALKAQVSPHELLQEVVRVSSKKFTITEQSDAMEFLVWFMNKMHMEMTRADKTGSDKNSRSRKSSLFHEVFQGEVEITTRRIDENTQQILEDQVTTRTVPFLFLGLDLPLTPLIKGSNTQTRVAETTTISQIPLGALLTKYNGVKRHITKTEARTYRIHRLPPYLILSIPRFSSTRWSEEKLKNSTIVSFSVAIDLASSIATTKSTMSDPTSSPDPVLYELQSNVFHEGKAPPAPLEGFFKVHLKAKGGEWVQIHDLHVDRHIPPPMIPLSESCIQVCSILC